MCVSTNPTPLAEATHANDTSVAMQKKRLGWEDSIRPRSYKVQTLSCTTTLCQDAALQPSKIGEKGVTIGRLMTVRIQHRDSYVRNSFSYIVG